VGNQVSVHVREIVCGLPLVDAPPIRGLLQRRLFERTEYRGPQGRTPAPSALMPRRWPIRLRLGHGAQEIVIAKLRRLLRERPAYYPGVAPAL